MEANPNPQVVDTVLSHEGPIETHAVIVGAGAAALPGSAPADRSARAPRRQLGLVA